MVAGSERLHPVQRRVVLIARVGDAGRAWPRVVDDMGRIAPFVPAGAGCLMSRASGCSVSSRDDTEAFGGIVWVPDTRSRPLTRHNGLVRQMRNSAQRSIEVYERSPIRLPIAHHWWIDNHSQCRRGESNPES